MSKFWKITLSVFGGILLVAILSMAIFYFYMVNTTTLDEEKINSSASELSVFSLNGDTLFTSEFAEINEIPTHLKNAFIAVEDKRFYSHKGVDFHRIGGAILSNFKAGSLKEGASTITQQLIKNTHLSPEKTFIRKFKEMILARKLEKKFSKDEILEKYLNILYFGNSIYGVSDASKEFFNKDIRDITLAESAILAGIIKSPAKYSPQLNYTNSVERSHTVLRLMKEQNLLNEDDYNTAIAEKVVVYEKKIDDNQAYKTAVFDEVAQLLGISRKSVNLGDYKIYTYFDAQKQDALIKAFENNPTLDTNGNSAKKFGIMLDNSAYGVSALFSDVNVSAFDFKRQSGSVIKPLFSYASALSEYSPCDVFEDEIKNFNGYQPSNYADSYHGNITLRDALAKSSNVVAVELCEKLGIQNCIKTANALGLKLNLSDCSLATALGSTTYGIKLINLASAYTTLANQGKQNPLSFIRQITDHSGKTLYTRNISPTQAIDSDTNYLLTDMLCTVSKEGTCAKLGKLPYDIASKSGTVSFSDANFNTDVYNISYTTKDTLLVWLGAEDNNKGLLTKATTGGKQPTSIAFDTYSKIYDDNPPSSFMQPQGVVDMKIDKYTLYKNKEVLKADETTPENFVLEEKFLQQKAPTQNSSTFNPPVLNNVLKRKANGKIYINFFAKKDETYLIEKFSSADILQDSITVHGEDNLSEFSSELFVGYIKITPTKDVGGIKIQGESDITKMSGLSFIFGF